MKLRPASMDDAALLLDVANEPGVRSASIHREVIAWDDHVAWLAARLASPSSAVFVVEEGGAPCGTVRFERGEPGRAEIAIALAAGQRGRGLGRRTIEAGCAAIAARWPEVGAVDAYVRVDNLASLRAFAAAGFDDAGPTTRDGADLRHLVRALGAGDA